LLEGVYELRKAIKLHKEYLHDFYSSLSIMGVIKLGGPGQARKVAHLAETKEGKQKLTYKAYKNLLPDMTSASIPVVTALRSCLSMYICYFLYIIK
jgi:hypothetical protein